MFVDQIAGQQRLVALSAIGERFPLHCTANGKAILACFAKEDTDALLGRVSTSTLITPSKIALSFCGSLMRRDASSSLSICRSMGRHQRGRRCCTRRLRQTGCGIDPSADGSLQRPARLTSAGSANVSREIAHDHRKMTNLSWRLCAQLSESTVGLADFREEGGCSDNNSPAAGPKPPDGKRRGDRRHADVSHHDRASPIIFSTASPSKP